MSNKMLALNQKDQYTLGSYRVYPTISDQTKTKVHVYINAITNNSGYGRKTTWQKHEFEKKNC